MKKARGFPVIGLALVLLSGLGGCSTIKDILGTSGAAKGSTTTGTRVAVLEESKKIEPDSDLKGAKPDMPKAVTVPAWPQTGYGPAHVMPDGLAPEHPQEAWSSNVGEGSDSNFKLLAKPVIMGGMVFTMDARGEVMAFDVKDGDRKWDVDTVPPDSDSEAMGGGIGADGDTLYATTGFGEILALKAADGSIKWRKTVLNPIRGAPTIAEGRVYVTTIDNELHALDAKTGDELWHHRGISESATLMGASSPAVESDSVIVAYSSGEVYNLRPENGRVAWSYTLTVPTQVGALPAIADIRGLPVVDQGRIFAISHSGRIAAIEQRIGDRVWEADIGGINTPLAVGNTVFVLSNDNQLIALTREAGRVEWIIDLQKLQDPEDHDSGPVFWAGPILAGNRLWLTNSMGQLVSFAPEDGKQIETVDLSGPVFVAPVAAGGTIYVVLDSGRLVALR